MAGRSNADRNWSLTTLSRDGWGGADDISAGITTAVGEALDVDAVELAPLYTAIDPDGLARIFGHRSDPFDPVTVTFRFEGCTVAVSDRGDVTVTPPGHRIG